MISIRVAFVLRLVDDFSGKFIEQKSFQFFVNGITTKPLAKENGQYVFLEPIEENAQIIVSGIDYHTRGIVLNKQELDPLEPVIELRLYPIAGRNLPYSYESFSGSLPRKKGETDPVEILAIRSKKTGLVFKEYRLEEQQHWLTLQGFSKENLIGKTCLFEGDKQQGIFVILEKRGMGEYRIEADGEPPISIKPGTALCRIFRSVTDGAGSYEIVVEQKDEISEENILILEPSKTVLKGRR